MIIKQEKGKSIIINPAHPLIPLNPRQWNLLIHNTNTLFHLKLGAFSGLESPDYLHKQDFLVLHFAHKIK